MNTNYSSNVYQKYTYLCFTKYIWYVLLFSHICVISSLCTFVVCTTHCLNVHKSDVAFSTIKLFHRTVFSYCVDLSYFQPNALTFSVLLHNTAPHVITERNLQNNIRKKFYVTKCSNIIHVFWNKYFIKPWKIKLWK